MKFKTQRIYQQGVEAFRAGRLELAEACFFEVLRDEPALEPAILCLGVVLARTGRLTGAVAVYENGLKMFRKVPRFITILAWPGSNWKNSWLRLNIMKLRFVCGPIMSMPGTIWHWPI